LAKFRETLSRTKDFMRLKESNAFFRTHLFVINAAKSETDGKYGLIASKKTFKNAINRNRARRLMREWLRLNVEMLQKNTDYVFVLRSSILNAGLEDGLKQTVNAISKINEML
jgi:ribonuclease P protein component